MTEANPTEEILNPQATLMLEHIHAKLPGEEDKKGIISEKGRLNKEGRALADDVYSEFLKRSGGNYREVLNICKDAASFLHEDDADSRDAEMLKVLRSVRGKVVYHAHKIWVEKEMLIDEFADESASNIMSYAKTLKRDRKIDVYEEAENIEKEKHFVDEKLRIENEVLEQQNLEIVTQDIERISQAAPPSERKSILEGLKGKLKAFSGKITEPSTRRKIVAVALSAVAIAGVVLGYFSHLNEGRKMDANTLAKSENQPKVLEVVASRQPLEADTVLVVTPNLYGITEEYLTGSDEIPEVILVESVKEQERHAPVYVAQTFNGQCGPATIAILESTSGPADSDIHTKVQDITNKFIERGYINPDRGDRVATQDQLVSFLNDNGFNADFSFEFLSISKIEEHFSNPENKPVIINVSYSYLQEKPDHWAVLLGIVEVDGVKYIHLMDPLTSAHGFGAQRELDVRMIGMDDGSFLLDARAWSNATNGLGVFVKS